MKTHTYRTAVTWTGNLGQGTPNYRGYSRNHEIAVKGKPPISGSSDPSFLGDPTRYNPEEMLVAALSSCHMLWYLHLCSANGISVMEYRDEASGTMEETQDGAGSFKEVVLFPKVTLEEGSDLGLAKRLHGDAHHFCFLARSVNFPVTHQPTFVVRYFPATRPETSS